MVVKYPSVTSLKVTWTLEGNAVKMIIDCRAANGNNKTVEITDGSREATCTDLTPGSEYTVTVTAYISDTNKKMSDVGNGVTGLYVCR